VLSYRNAAVVLSETRSSEFSELIQSLRDFSITTTMIRTAGGNESAIPKLLTKSLRPKGWHETIIQGDLLVTLRWKEETGYDKRGKPIFAKRSRELRREKFLDGHKIDFVKNKVAFDLEWNSKDQTFDRDLYAFSAFFLSGAIDVGIQVTRSESMNSVFRQLGPALKRDGSVETKDGAARQTHTKYGASTTWMGKLIYRLNAGRNGGCPVLAIGITPDCVSDWPTEKI
jgi:Restriction endonuclease BglII